MQQDQKPGGPEVTGAKGTAGAAGWTFLTNHSHVLICLARDPAARLRDVAAEVGITERAVQRIVSDLEIDGVLTHVREGRRNRYAVHAGRHLRHPVEAHTTIAALLGIVQRPAEKQEKRQEERSDNAAPTDR